MYGQAKKITWDNEPIKIFTLCKISFPNKRSSVVNILQRILAKTGIIWKIYILSPKNSNGEPSPLFQSLMLRQQCSPPQESPSSQDSSFLNLVPWRKIFSRFQSSTTLAVLFLYVCIIYIQSGKMTLTDWQSSIYISFQTLQVFMFRNDLWQKTFTKCQW